MNAIKVVRRFIAVWKTGCDRATNESAKILARLVLAL